MHQPIYSPCIRICAVNPKTGFCDGCYRTLPEIAKWTRFTHEERDDILAALPERGEQVWPPCRLAARPSKLLKKFFAGLKRHPSTGSGWWDFAEAY